MGRCILKLAENEYVEWSTVVDAPTTTIGTRDEIREFLAREHYWHTHPDALDASLRRADEHGHSFLDQSPMSAEKFIRGNRAGPDESELNLDEIRAEYRE